MYDRWIIGFGTDLEWLKWLKGIIRDGNQGFAHLLAHEPADAEHMLQLVQGILHVRTCRKDGAQLLVVDVVSDQLDLRMVAAADIRFV